MRNPEEVDCPHAEECFGGGYWGKGAWDDPLSSAAGGRPWSECRCMTEEERAELKMKDGYCTEAVDQMMKELPMARICEEHNIAYADGGKCYKCHPGMAEPNEHDARRQQGLKYDGDKIDWAHLPPKAIEEVLKVYMMGAKKYHRGNYLKGIDFRRVFNAAQRHLWAWKKGEDIDPESGLSHLAHAAWNCITLLEYMIDYEKFKNFDNRSEIEQPPETTVWPEAPVACDHEWIWGGQYTDTAGVHVTRRCKKCAEYHVDHLGVEPPNGGGISIPSMWIPNIDGTPLEVTVTTSAPADAPYYEFNLNPEKPSATIAVKALSKPKPKFKAGDRVKIRDGARYGQDMAYWTWHGDNNVVFTVRGEMKNGNDPQRYQLWADGYGAGLKETGPGNYGNGCVFVEEKDLIDVNGGE